MQYETVEVDGIGYYKVGDQLLPRITAVIGEVVPKPWMTPWINKVGGKKNADRIKEYSAAVGTMFHWRRESDDLYPVVPDLPDIDWSVVSSDENIRLLEIAESIWSEVGISFRRPCHVEKTVICLDPEISSAGTADRIGEVVDGKGIIAKKYKRFNSSLPSISDFKTSGQYKEEYGIQAAAYRLNAREMGLGEYDQAVILGIHPYSSMEVSWRARTRSPSFWCRVLDVGELDDLEEKWVDIRMQFGEMW